MSKKEAIESVKLRIRNPDGTYQRVTLEKDTTLTLNLPFRVNHNLFWVNGAIDVSIELDE